MARRVEFNNINKIFFYGPSTVVSSVGVLAGLGVVKAIGGLVGDSPVLKLAVAVVGLGIAAKLAIWGQQNLQFPQGRMSTQKYTDMELGTLTGGALGIAAGLVGGVFLNHTL